MLTSAPYIPRTLFCERTSANPRGSNQFQKALDCHMLGFRQRGVSYDAGYLCLIFDHMVTNGHKACTLAVNRTGTRRRSAGMPVRYFSRFSFTKRWTHVTTTHTYVCSFIPPAGRCQRRRRRRQGGGHGANCGSSGLCVSVMARGIHQLHLSSRTGVRRVTTYITLEQLWNQILTLVYTSISCLWH